MLNLTNLLRNLLYHTARAPRQVSRLVATVLLVTADVAASDDHLALTTHVEHLLRFIILLIGSAVVMNILLRHGNELLARFIHEQDETWRESRRMAQLLKTLLLGPKEPDETEKSKNKPAPDGDAKEPDETEKSQNKPATDGDAKE
jgi:hypothetical protein